MKLSGGFQEELKEGSRGHLLHGSEWNAVGKAGGEEPEDLGHHLRSLNFILSAVKFSDKFEPGCLKVILDATQRAMEGARLDTRFLKCPGERSHC